MAGRIYLAAVGDDLIAVERTTRSLQDALDDLSHRFGTARLVWSTPGTPKDVAAVHAALQEHHVSDQNLFKMTADQVTELIERIKERVRRQMQDLQAARWIARVAAAAAEELRKLQHQEDQPVDMRTSAERQEEDRRAEEAEMEAVMDDAGGDVDEVVAHLQQRLLERCLDRLSAD